MKHDPRKSDTGGRMMARLHFKLLSPVITLLLMFFTSLSAFGFGGENKGEYVDLRPGVQEAKANAVVVDKTGSMIMTGYTKISGTDDDIWTVKFKADVSGVFKISDTPEVYWRAQYGHSASGSDRGMALALDSSDNVIVTGFVWNGTNTDIHTIKYCNNNDPAKCGGKTPGSVIWQHTYHPAGNRIGMGLAVATDDLNNVYIGGNIQNGSYDDYIIFKYKDSGPDTEGKPEWVTTYNGPTVNDDNTIGNVDKLTSLAVGKDSAGNYMVAVTGQSATKTGSTPPYRFDAFTKTYNGVDGTERKNGSTPIEWRYATTKDSVGRKVLIDKDGNVIVTISSGGSSQFDIYTAKYNATTGSATPIWANTESKLLGYNQEPNNMVLDNGGDVYVTGYVITASGNDDVYAVRYKGSDGSKVWPQDVIIDSRPGISASDFGTSIILDAGGDVYIGGYTVDSSGNDDMLAIKLAGGSGAKLWQSAIDGPDGIVGKDARSAGIGIGLNNWLLVGGWADLSSGGPVDYDYYVVALDAGKINAPSGLKASTLDNTSIYLEWTNNAVGQNDGFIVEHKDGEQGEWRKVGAGTVTVGSDVTNFTDTGLTQNITYYFRVTAYSALNGVSNPSAEAHALTLLVTYQAPAWQYIHGEDGNGQDFAKGIAVGPDNHPVIAGYVNRLDTTDPVNPKHTDDYFTVKLNRTDKSTIWSDIYNDFNSETDIAVGVTVDNANAAYVTGYSVLWPGCQGCDDINSIFTMKYTDDYIEGATPPTMQWEAQYNGPFRINDKATTVGTATDGNSIAVVGYGYNAPYNEDPALNGYTVIYLVKYLANPDLGEGVTAPYEWYAKQDRLGTPAINVAFDGGGDAFPSAVAFDKAGNVLVTGYVKKKTGTKDYDIFTAKYCGSTTSGCPGGKIPGDMLWVKIFDGKDAGNLTLGKNDKGQSLAMDLSDNIYVTGSSVNAVGNEDIITIKFQGSDGAQLWATPYDGPAHGDDFGVSVKYDQADDTIVVGGITHTGTNNNDLIVIKYDSSGNEKKKNIHLRPDNDDAARDMAMDISGNVTLVGYTTDLAGSSADTISVKFDYDLNLIAATIFDAKNTATPPVSLGKDDEAATATVNFLGEIFVAGYTTNAADNVDFLVYKMDASPLQVCAPFTATPYYRKVDLLWTDTSTTEYQPITKGIAGSGTTTTLQDNLLTSGSIWTADAYKDKYLLIVSVADPARNANIGRYKKITANTTGRLITVQSAFPVAIGAGDVYNIIEDPTDTAHNGEDGFIIERKIDDGTCSATEPSSNGWSQLNKQASHDYSVGPHNNSVVKTVSYSDTGLTTGDKYCYRVRSFKTSQPNPQPDQRWVMRKVVLDAPQSPINLTAIAINTTKIDLSWHTRTSGDTGYKIYRCEGEPCVFPDPEVTPPNFILTGPATTFSDTTVENNKQYGYKVFSYIDDPNSGWTSPLSEPAYATTPQAYTPSSVTATVVNNGKVTVTWSEPTANADETGYKIRRCEGANCTTFADNPPAGTPVSPANPLRNPVGTTGPDVFNFNDTLALKADTIYRYQVCAFKTATNGWEKCSVLADNPNPPPLLAYEAKTTSTAPSLLTATAVSGSSSDITITWSDTTGSETNFIIERCTGTTSTCTEDNQFAKVGTAAAGTTSFTDPTVCENITYTYRVRAANHGLSNDSGTLAPGTWAYRKEIDFGGNFKANTLAQISVNMISGKMNADFSDLRIFDESSQKELQYVFANKNAAATTLVFQTGAYNSLALYYGNPNATTPALGISDPNLVAYWPFKESYNTMPGKTADISGKGNNLDLMNFTAPNGARAVIGGNALSVNGSNNYVINTAPSAALNLSTNFTIMGWVYPKASQWGGILDRGRAGTSTWEIFYETNGSISYRQNWQQGGESTFTSAGSVPLNQWTHFAAVYTDKSVKIYINGVENTAAAKTFTNNPLPQADDWFELGSNRPGGYEYFNGLIDEVRIYNIAMSPENVFGHFSAVNSGSPALDNGLVGYWPFEETAGTIPTQTADASGNNTPLTLSNFNTPNGIVTGGVVSGETALSFNGSNFYAITTKPTSDLNLSTNFTLMGWINPKASQVGSIVDRGHEGSGTWEVRYESSDRISYGQNWNQGLPGGWERTYTASGSVPLNTWTHFAAVYTNKSVKIYLNGVEDTAAARTFSSNPAPQASDWIEIGADRQGDDRYLNGLVDEIRIYKSALTASEVLAIAIQAAPISGALQAEQSFNGTFVTAWTADLISNTRHAAANDAAPPSGLGANVFSETQINLNWSNNSTTVAEASGIKVMRCSGGASAGCTNYAQVGSDLAPNATSFNDTGLTPNNYYSYKVVAFKNVACTSWSHDTSILESNTVADVRTTPVAPAWVDAQTNAVVATVCEDIRLTKNDGTTLLAGQWAKKSTCGSSVPNMWMKFQGAIPASSTQTVYYYYGHPTAPSLISGSNTFDLYDEFNGTTIDSSKWTVVGTYYSQDNTLISSGGSANWDSGMYSVANFDRPFIFEVEYFQTGGINMMIGAKNTGTGLSNGDFMYAMFPYLIFNGSSNTISAYEDGYNRGDKKTGITPNTWQYYKLDVLTAGANYYYGAAPDTFENIYSTTSGTTSPLKVGFSNYNQAFKLDNLRVRKGASVIPTVTAGAKESGAWTVDGQTFKVRIPMTVAYTGTTPLNDFQIQLPAIDTTSLQSDRIMLTWTDSTSTETGFTIQRCSGTTNCSVADFTPTITFDNNNANVGIASQLQPQAGAGLTVTFADRSVVANTNYCYRVKPDLPTGEVLYTGVVCKTTSLPKGMLNENILPTTSGSQVTLPWNDYTSNEEGFVIERCSSGACVDDGNNVCTNCDSGFPKTIGPNAGGTTAVPVTATWIDNGTCTGSTYNYRVKSIKPWVDDWPSDYSNSISVPVNPALAPTSVTATRVSETQINLSWSYTSADESVIQIWRCTGDSSVCTADKFFQVGSDLAKGSAPYYNNNTYSDTGLTPNTTYTYQVRAAKYAATCPWTSISELSATHTETATTTALTPTSFTATPANSTLVNLGFTNATVSDSGFKIQRCSGAGCTDFSDLKDINSSSLFQRVYKAFYSFNNTLNDSSGNNLNLTQGAGTLAYEDGGLALNTGTWFQSATTDILNNDNHAIEFDIKFRDTSGWYPKIFGFNAGGSDRSPGLWQYTNQSKLHWRYDPNNSGVNELGVTGDGGTPFTLGTWYHIRGVKTGANLTVYVNGAQVVNTTVSNPKPAGSATLWFGGANVTIKNFSIETDVITYAKNNNVSLNDDSVCPGNTYSYRVESTSNLTGDGGIGGNWTNYMPLAITNFQPGFQTRVTIPWKPKMKADFSDIRFYDATAKIVLPYWIESKTDGSTATVWFKTAANNNINLYYGNPTAVSASSGSSVFDFFDDFTTLNTQVWSKSTSAADISVNGSGSGTLVLNTGGVATNAAIASSPQNTVFEMKNRWTDQKGTTGLSSIEIADSPYIQSNNSGTNAKIENRITYSGGTTVIKALGGDGTTASYNLTSQNYYSSPPENTDMIVGIEFVGGTGISVFSKDPVTYADKARTNPNITTGTWSKPVYMILGYPFGTNAGTFDGWDMVIDWVRTRKYIATEPSVTLGIEQPPAIGTALTSSTIWQWSRKAPVAISNFQPNYPTKVAIPASIVAGRTTVQLNDLRFRDETAGVELPYWVENVMADGTALVWIKAGTNDNIKMYYGNSAAIYNGNGSAVFEFFDDFFALDTSKWSKSDPAADITVNTLGTGKIRINNGAIYSKATVVPTPQNRMYEMKSQWVSPRAVTYSSGLTVSNYQYFLAVNAGNSAYAINRLENVGSLRAQAGDGASASNNVSQEYYPNSSGTTLAALDTDSIIGIEIQDGKIGYFSKNPITYADLARDTKPGSISIQNTNKNWTVNGFSGKTLLITSGLNNGLSRTILSNTATSISVFVRDTTPDTSFPYFFTSGDTYQIINPSDSSILDTGSVTGTWNAPSYLFMGSNVGSGQGTPGGSLYDGTDLIIDWVRVRPYSATEPTGTITIASDSLNTPSASLTNPGTVDGGGSGTWTTGAPLSIANFQPNFATRMSIPAAFTASMKADLSDLRFYDTVAGVELPYWVETKTANMGSAPSSLSNAGGGTWTKRQLLSISNFKPNFLTKIVIPASYVKDMKADLSDLRFYDFTAPGAELPYWIQGISSSTPAKATVWLMTGANNTITMYYGNPSASGVSSRDTVLGAGLAGYWPFEEAVNTTTGTTADVSGNGMNATLTGTPTVVATGKFDNGLSLNGTSAYATIPVSSGSALDSNGSFTVELWYYHDAAATTTCRSLLQRNYDVVTNQKFNLYLSCDGTVNGEEIGNSYRTVNFSVQDSNNLSFRADTAGNSPALVNNAWNHIIGRYDAAAGKISVIINGVERSANTTVPGGFTSLVSSGQPLKIGTNKDITSFLPSRVDDVRIYNRALSDPEIAFHYSPALPYVMVTESVGTMNNPTVWLKTGANNNIMMYYGNPAATAISNGSNVFDFFEDFATLDVSVPTANGNDPTTHRWSRSVNKIGIRKGSAGASGNSETSLQDDGGSTNGTWTTADYYKDYYLLIMNVADQSRSVNLGQFRKIVGNTTDRLISTDPANPFPVAIGAGDVYQIIYNPTIAANLSDASGSGNDSMTITTGALYSNAPVISSSPINHVFEMKNKWDASGYTGGGLSISNSQYATSSNGNDYNEQFFAHADLRIGTGGLQAVAGNGAAKTWNVGAPMLVNDSGASPNSYANVTNKDWITGIEFRGTNDIYFSAKDPATYTPQYSKLINNTSGIWTPTSPYPSATAPYIFFDHIWGYNAGISSQNPLNVDWVRVRGYAPVEPIVTVGVAQAFSGFSNANGGTWSTGAPLSITNFQPNTLTMLVVPAATLGAMKSDLSDLRFYDAATKTELPYWVAGKYGSPQTATVWLKTGSSSNIFMYYGNPSASAVSSQAVMSGSGLMAFWPFEEPVGTTSGQTSDASDHNLSGDINSGASIVSGGMYGGNALSVDGASGNVIVNDTAGSSLDITGSMTIELWYKYDKDCASYKYLLSKLHDNGGFLYTIYTNDAKGVKFKVGDGTTNQIIDTVTSLTMVDGAWYHIVAKYDKTVSPAAMSLFVNGQRLAYTTFSSPITIATSDRPLTIGALTASAYAKGTIDNIRIYNLALPEATIGASFSTMPLSSWNSAYSSTVTVTTPTSLNLNSVNLISNSDFENGSTGWNLNSNGGSIALDSSTAASGTHSVKITGTLQKNSGSAYFNQALPKLTPGASYQLTGNIKANLVNGYVYCRLMDNNWNNPATPGWVEYQLYFNDAKNNNQWQSFSLPLTLNTYPAIDGANLWVVCGFYRGDDSGANGTDTAYLDGLQLTQLTGSLVINPDFESGATGWTLGSAAASIAANTASNGSNTVKIASTTLAPNSQEIISQAVPVLTPGATYTLTGNIKANLTNGYAFCRLMANNGSWDYPLAEYSLASSSTITWNKTDNNIPTTADSGTTPVNGDGRLPLGVSNTNPSQVLSTSPYGTPTDRGDSGSVQGAAAIKEDATHYRMWYSANDHGTGGSWRIYYATSSDGITWTKAGSSLPLVQDSGITPVNNNGRLGLGSDVAGIGDRLNVYVSSAVIKDVKSDGITPIYKMWYTGHDRSNWRIYYATSPDGLNWTKYDNTVPANSNTTGTNGRIPLGLSGSGDSSHTYAPTVVKDSTTTPPTYKMWYSGHNGSNFRIYYAYSTDGGLTWTKQNNTVSTARDSGATPTDNSGQIPLGSSGMGDDNAAQMPHVIWEEGSTFKMWYAGQYASAYNNPSPRYNRVLYATSTDGGLNWTKQDNSVIGPSDNTSSNYQVTYGTAASGDAYGPLAPFVLKEDTNAYSMWYSGIAGGVSRIYRATTSDGGTSWAKQNNSIPTRSDAGGDQGRIPQGMAAAGDTFHTARASVLQEGPNSYKMWYTGSDGVNWRIYYATSSDGLNWTKQNSSVPDDSDTTSSDGRIPKGTAGKGDGYNVLAPNVVKEDESHYKMWYTGHDGINWRGVYQATSSDGLNWTKTNNIIFSATQDTGAGPGGGRLFIGTNGNGDSRQVILGSGSVVWEGGSNYKMWYGGHDGSYWRIYMATSTDGGVTWTKQDNTVPADSDTTGTYGRIPKGTAGKGDSNGAIYPTVYKDGSTYRMWYAGADGWGIWRIYHATSSDGLNWTKQDNSIPAPSDGISINNRIPLGNDGKGDGTQIQGANVIKDGSTFRMWYTAYDQSTPLRFRIFNTVQVSNPATLNDNQWHSFSLPVSLKSNLSIWDAAKAKVVCGIARDNTGAATATDTANFDMIQLTPTASPLYLSATRASETQINLAWSDMSSDETGYTVERCSGQNCALTPSNFSQIATLAAGSTSYSDLGLTPNTWYSYRMTAYKTATCGWNSNYSNIVTAQTSFSALTSSTSARLNVSSPTSGQINLSWNDVITGEAGYSIERCAGVGCTFSCGNATCSYPTSSQITTAAADAINFNNTGLTAGTSYSYRIRAYNSDGAWNGNYSNVATIIATANSTQSTGTLSGTVINTTQINLEWSNMITGESGYKIERCTGLNCNFSVIDAIFPYYVAPNTASFNDTTVCNGSVTPAPPGPPYSYRIYAANETGPSNSGGGSWTKRAKLNINNFQANLPIRFTIDRPANMQSFNEMRFIDTGTGVELPYFIEKTTAAANGYPDRATVWIKAGAINSIYLYYGNTSAASASSVTGVFGTGLIGFWPFNETAGTVSGELAEMSGYNSIEPMKGYFNGSVLLDGSFENGSASWSSPVGTATGTSFDDVGNGGIANSGSKSLKLDATGATLGLQQTVSVTPNKSYTLSGYIKSAFTSGTAQCDVYGTGIDSGGIWTSSNTWTRKTETITIPNGTTSVNIRCFANGGPQGQAWFDNIQLYPAMDLPYGIVTAGRYFNGINLNGNSNLVSVPDFNNSPLDITGALTVEAWYQYQPSSNWGRIVSKPTTGGAQPWDLYSLFLNDNTDKQQATFVICNTNKWTAPTAPPIGQCNYSATGPSFVPGSWYHVVGRWNPNYDTKNGLGEMALFVNGVKYSSTPAKITIATSDEPFGIGGRGSFGDKIKGVIDEVRLYNRALTDAEIQARYAAVIPTMTGFGAEEAVTPSATPIAQTTITENFDNDSNIGKTVTWMIEAGHSWREFYQIYSSTSPKTIDYSDNVRGQAKVTTNTITTDPVNNPFNSNALEFTTKVLSPSSPFTVDYSDSANFIKAKVTRNTTVNDGVLELATQVNGGSGNNYEMLELTNPALVNGDFDIQFDYFLPDGQLAAPTQYNRYVRFRIDTANGEQYIVERATKADPNDGNKVKNAFVTSLKVDGVTTPTLLSTGDLFGKMRIAKTGSQVIIYKQSPGSSSWDILASASNAAAGVTGSSVHFVQYLSRSELVKTQIRAFIDNVKNNLDLTNLNDNFASDASISPSPGSIWAMEAGHYWRTDYTRTLVTASPYNYEMLYMNTPEVLKDDFDIQFDYSLPDGQLASPTQYNLYARLRIDTGDDGNGINQYIVERATIADPNSGNAVKNAYVTYLRTNGAPSVAKILLADDTSGKIRINKKGNLVTLYKMTANSGTWDALADADNASHMPVSGLTIMQSLSTEPASTQIRTLIDNINIVYPNQNQYNYSWNYSPVNSGYSNVVANIVPTSPQAPTGVTAMAATATTATNDSQITVTWANANTDQSGFKIWLCPENDASCTIDFKMAPFGTVGYDSRSFVATGLKPSTTYCFRVSAYKNTWCRWDSPASDITASSCDKTGASYPSTLSALPSGSYKIALAWDEYSSTDVSGFEIQTKLFGGSWTTIATVGAAERSYVDTVGIEPNKTYTYRIRNFRTMTSPAATDYSPYSNEASATTPPDTQGGNKTCR